MSKIKVGKVAITHEGNWSIDKTYEVNTCVNYGGSTYMSIKQVKGIQPSNDGINWRLMASKGDKGERGTDGSVSFNSLTTAQKNTLKGEKGDQGYYFTPEIDSQGNLSWSNNGDLTNPATINLKGPKGDRGAPGDLFALNIEKDITTGQQHLYLYDKLGSLSDLFILDQDGHLYLNFN